MKRRDFITLLGGAAAAWPVLARAEQRTMPLIGYLSARSPKTDVPMLAAFRRGLSESGYVEGNNVAIEFRWGGGQYDPLPELEADLVHRRVGVIVTSGGPAPALAAKAATDTIPILFVTAGDPVQEGLVGSLNRPGGNITGVGTFFFSLGAKQLGLMRELLPNADLFALLIDPKMASSAESQADDTEAAGRAVGQRLIVLRASTERETSCRDLRPHHVQRDRIGTWEISGLAVRRCVRGTVRIGKVRSRSRWCTDTRSRTSS